MDEDELLSDLQGRILALELAVGVALSFAVDGRSRADIGRLLVGIEGINGTLDNTVAFQRLEPSAQTAATEIVDRLGKTVRVAFGIEA